MNGWLTGLTLSPITSAWNRDRTLAGRWAIEFMTQFTPSYFVTSMVAGSNRGCFDFDLFEAEFKRAMIPLADQTMVLMDSSKFCKSSLIHVCDWSDVDVLVTDGASEDVLSQIDHGYLLLTELPSEKSAG